MARARSSGSQWSRPVAAVNADGTTMTSAPPASPGAGRARGSAGRSRPTSRSRRPSASPTTISAPARRGGRLAVGDAAHVDVEHVQLAVDVRPRRRPAAPGRSCCRPRPSAASSMTLPARIATPSSRAQPRAAATEGPSRSSAPSRGARTVDVGPLLGQHHQARAGLGGAPHQLPGGGEVAFAVGRAGHLDRGDPQGATMRGVGFGSRRRHVGGDSHRRSRTCSTRSAPPCTRTAGTWSWWSSTRRASSTSA